METKHVGQRVKSTEIANSPGLRGVIVSTTNYMFKVEWDNGKVESCDDYYFGTSIVPASEMR